MDSLYEKLSKKRKKLQEQDLAPEFFTTGGYQLFASKYQTDAETPREQYERIARTLAKHAPTTPDWWPEGKTWFDAFFHELWSGWTSPSTPVLSNTGTDKGMPVSCSGNVAANDIYDIYGTRQEVAVLTKYAFGTATYLGDIAPRGTISAKGVKCSGVMPIITGIVDDMRYVAQGANRRGAWAGYLPIDHGDYQEVVTYLKQHPDDLNIGWVVRKDFKDKLDNGDVDATFRYQTSLDTKMTTGKGYYFFHWKAQDARPQMYKDLGLEVVAPQLCN